VGDSTFQTTYVYKHYNRYHLVNYILSLRSSVQNVAQVMILAEKRSH